MSTNDGTERASSLALRWRATTSESTGDNGRALAERDAEGIPNLSRRPSGWESKCLQGKTGKLAEEEGWLGAGTKAIDCTVETDVGFESSSGTGQSSNEHTDSYMIDIIYGGRMLVNPYLLQYLQQKFPLGCSLIQQHRLTAKRVEYLYPRAFEQRCLRNGGWGERPGHST